MKALKVVSVLLVLTACNKRFNEKDLYGCYSPVGFQNTYDTICLKADGIYHRKVYDKNKSLVLETTGKWFVEKKAIIHFDNFFLNLDRDIVKYRELVQDTLGGGGGLLENKKGIIQFCVGYHEGENCYQKIR